MAYIYDLTDTWNAGGTTFNAIKMNVTDSASAAGSKLVTLQTNGTEHFSVTKAGVGYFSGNVGIGTSSPSYKLDVTASGSNIRAYTASGNAEILAQSAASGVAILDLQTSAGLNRIAGGVGSTSNMRFYTASTERMIIDASGNVGIGTSSPGEKLQVVGSIRVNTTGTIFSNTYSAGNTQTWFVNNSSSSDTYLTSDGAQRYRLLTGVGFTWETAVSGTLGASVSWTERMRLDNSGNVGIGTSSVSSVFGTTVRAFDAGNGATLQIGGSTVNAYFFASEGLGRSTVGNSTAHPLTFITSDTERMRITSAGELLINRSSASGLGKLNVEGGADFTGGNVLMCRDTGNVGIGTSSPAQKLSVNGNIVTTGEIALSGADFIYSWAGGTTGQRRAGFYLDGSNQVVRFYTAQNEVARIDSSGNLLVGTTSANGSMANTSTTNSGVFNTLNGSVSTASGAATTIATANQNYAFATYIVSCGVSSGVPSAYSAVAIVSADNNVLQITNLQTATNMTISVSGTNIQATQTSGGTATIIYSIIRIG